jgi:glucosamine--fructose-6-phosphate aminotransferase (isomerizing)
MCGIIAGIINTNIADSLIEGLERLEYRGYDSSGLAVIKSDQSIIHRKSVGKVSELKAIVKASKTEGQIGIAHTRWATHGKPSTLNAHPHLSHDCFAIVHNGIIENYETLKEELIAEGYEFSSETDSEVLVHLIHQAMQSSSSLFDAVQSITPKLEGSYALAAIDKSTPDTLVVARRGSPLIIGLSDDQIFAASDVIAFNETIEQCIYLEDEDVAAISKNLLTVMNNGEIIPRPINSISGDENGASKGSYTHFMHKEIHEQPQAIQRLIDAYLTDKGLFSNTFPVADQLAISRIKNITIVACGSSYHAALIAKLWFEAYAEIQCQVEIASEFRYRKSIVPKRSLFIAISQSGETADTLAALGHAKKLGYKKSLAICNSNHSSLVRETDLCLLTHAGKEISVASTKAFTSQLTVFLMLAIYFAQKRKLTTKNDTMMDALKQLPDQLSDALTLEPLIEKTVTPLAKAKNCLFIGRGEMHSIAMEGALKLKEISYIHAEAYAAGELKHGPIALIDDKLPVIVIAPNNDVLSKIQSNINEVKARGGQVYIFSDSDDFDQANSLIPIAPAPSLISPIIYSIPLQLLAYHIALLKGNDIDQPRNLAKSVTVE